MVAVPAMKHANGNSDEQVENVAAEHIGDADDAVPPLCGSHAHKSVGEAGRCCDHGQPPEESGCIQDLAQCDSRSGLGPQLQRR